MKKILVVAIIAVLIVISSCKPMSETARPSEKPVMEKQQPTQIAIGDVTSDSFGNDTNSANNDDKELSSGQLDGADLGFQDIENM